MEAGRSALGGLEFGDEGFWAARQVTEFADGFAIRVEEEKSGVALDSEFFLEFSVGLLLGGRELFAAGEVDFQKNEFVLGIFFELHGVEDFFFEADAPAAPVGAGEVNEHVALCFGGGV